MVGVITILGMRKWICKGDTWSKTAWELVELRRNSSSTEHYSGSLGHQSTYIMSIKSFFNSHLGSKIVPDFGLKEKSPNLLLVEKPCFPLFCLFIWLFACFISYWWKRTSNICQIHVQNISELGRWPGEVSEGREWSEWAQTLQGHGIYLTRMSE